MQGNTHVNLLPRAGRVLTLLVGIQIGSTLLAMLLLAGQELGLSTRPYANSVFVITALMLLTGDAWAIARGRLYPFGLRRQTPKVLLYRRVSDPVKGLLWGVDLGLGMSTLRVTSGIWLLVLGILTLNVSVWTLAIYGGAFAAMLGLAIAWPARDPASVAVTRALQLLRRRRAAQIQYASLAGFVVAITALRAW